MERAVEPSDVLYDKKDYVSTKIGNRISKKSVLCGPDKICVLGKTIIEPGTIIRGDLAAVTVGQNCIIGERVVLRAPDQFFKGGVVSIPITIGEFCIIEQDTVVQAASIGSCVRIGKNCIIGKRCLIKDCVEVLDNSIVAPGTVIAPFSVYGGSPARFIRKLPESFPIVWMEHVRAYYRHFKSHRPELHGVSQLSPKS